MRFSAKAVYLGAEQRESKKTENKYWLVKLMDETSSIFEMYVPERNKEVVDQVGALQQLSKVEAGFSVTSFNNKPQIDLIGVQEVKGK